MYLINIIINHRSDMADSGSTVVNIESAPSYYATQYQNTRINIIMQSVQLCVYSIIMGHILWNYWKIFFGKIKSLLIVFEILMVFRLSFTILMFVSYEGEDFASAANIRTYRNIISYEMVNRGICIILFFYFLFSLKNVEI